MSTVANTNLQKRLLLGISPVDSVRLRDLRFPVRVELETDVPHRSGLTARQFSHNQYPVRRKVEGLTRHPGGRYSLHYYPAATQQVTLRFYEPHRSYVPRRIRFPLVTLEQILATEETQAADYLQSRVKYPVLFPGAAYPLTSRATGLRGLVIQNEEIVRWAVIELLAEGDPGQVLARARGDDRGEFLLLLPPSAVPDVALSETVTFDLRVWARATALVPNPIDIASQDPYWDLPIEEVVDPQADDDVSRGHLVPDGYVASQSLQSVSFSITRIQTGIDVGEINFNPP